MGPEKKGQRIRIAAFDFDGTISYRDSLLPFLIFSKGYLRAFWLIAKKLPLLCRFLLGRAGRQEVKEGLLKAFFQGCPLGDLEALGGVFAKEYLPKHVKPEAMQRVRWHQRMGDRCILVSASIESYLIPWGKLNGFDGVLASKVAADERGRVTGKLSGLNCRGREKVRRLQELLGPLDAYEIFAYGDSAGDKELLEVAAHPYYRSFPRDET